MTGIRIAYLDISPRQTGKTERLVQCAKPYLAAGRNVRFVTHYGLVEDMQRRLPGARILPNSEALLDDTDDSVWFYDEFDWLDSTKVRPGAYYATTPKFLRTLGVDTAENDLLLRLIEANSGHFQRYTWPFYMGDTLSEARLVHSPEDFRLLYLGEFLK